MKYYQEITILPCTEVPAYFLWSKVYQKLHLGFASQKDVQGNIPVGVSFPSYRENEDSSSEGEEACALGYKLRLFAEDETVLERFALSKLLHRLEDYVHITRVRPVPKNLKGYATYSRFHQRNSVEQKARRYAKRHDISYENAEQLFPVQKFEEGLPYIQMKSSTNQNMFRLFIKKENKDYSVNEGFSSYGLSNRSTVPEF